MRYGGELSGLYGQCDAWLAESGMAPGGGRQRE